MAFWRTLLDRAGFAPAEPGTATRSDQREHGRTPALRAAALEQILQEHVAALGSDHPRTITSRNNLASKYAQIGRREAAVAQFEQALRDAAAHYGEDHGQTDVVRENLAWSYEDSGRHAEAAEQWETLLKRRDEHLGPVAGDTVAARSRLAINYRKSGRYDAAIAHYEKAIEDAGVPEAREDLRLGLSLACASASRDEDGIQQLRMVLAQRRRRLGARHLDHLLVQHRLGRAYTQAGRLEDAVETLHTAYFNGLSAAGDPDIRMLTLRMRRDLAGALSALGRHREAAALF
ncbi:tetratricopeptide repeat protein [Streptomonospora wellingtoniae]|uniref:Tetratricopeptide repeat protein n=1 Tax=Streptomonospora wellingtoniae TaxID=3075544 RepID=A0ABU2KU62_9ACTN|nr:tetratricopeptide repeat protein [Streptomonospora sp. DSM 45055]MDT0302837.1 tetratricopeptide repeat protein [Streptomonospora sp. DSM 45055]